MDDPQRELKQWLAEKVSAHGEAKRLASAIGLSSDKITRSKELDSPDPKKRRTLQYEEIRAIAMHYRELPPGYEGMTQWLRDADANPYRRVVSSFDPDDVDPDIEADASFEREHWRPSIAGALPELDVKLGAGSGHVGEMITLRVGQDTVSGHRVAAEWLFSEQFLRHEAKASINQTIVMEVVGDSMQPSYLPGDRVLVDLSQDSMLVDTVYAISDGSSEPQIKRLQRVPFSDPVQVRIISDNQIFPIDIVELNRLTIIGRVCGHIARK